jgi:ribosome-associated protein
MAPRISIRQRDFSREFIITASRSSGPGGQHVNKVNTQIQLRFNVSNSALLEEKEKMVLLYKLRHQLTRSGDLLINSQTERSQIKNKTVAINKFYTLLENLLVPPKRRIATHPTPTSNTKRLERKKKHGEKKLFRKKLY